MIMISSSDKKTNIPQTREAVTQLMAQISVNVITSNTALKKFFDTNEIAKYQVTFKNMLGGEEIKTALKNIQKYRQDILDKKSNGEVSIKIGDKNVSIDFLDNVTKSIALFIELLESKEFKGVLFSYGFVFLFSAVSILFIMCFIKFIESLEKIIQEAKTVPVPSVYQAKIKDIVLPKKEISNLKSIMFFILVIIFILIALTLFIYGDGFDFNMFIFKIVRDQPDYFSKIKKGSDKIAIILVIVFTIILIPCIFLNVKRILELKILKGQENEKIFSNFVVKFVILGLPVMLTLFVISVGFYINSAKVCVDSKPFKNFADQFLKTFSETRPVEEEIIFQEQEAKI